MLECFAHAIRTVATRMVMRQADYDWIGANNACDLCLITRSGLWRMEDVSTSVDVSM